MTERITRYLARRADLESRPLVSGSLDGITQAVVIPVLAERENLAHTLDSLAANPSQERDRTLVICVVNNRVEPHAEVKDIADNQDTLLYLREALRDSRLRLAYIDAASPGCELPPKAGVGLARKLGLDWATAMLHRNGLVRAPLLCLDADTLVAENYLASVTHHFEREESWAASIAYVHRLEGSASECSAIRCYELFLRYHVLGLRYAGSPYAFHSVGSAMACRMDAYAAIGGMNQRQAGEDFYFLQQLAKTGGVETLTSTTVFPSCRPSHRVPFGTGQRVRRFLAGTENEYLLDDPRVYQILKAWLEVATEHCDTETSVFLTHAHAIAPQLSDFLEHRGFPQAWETIRKNAKGNRQLLAQFHRWFDGFETVKLIHYLRDQGYPLRDMSIAFNELLGWGALPGVPQISANLQHDLSTQDALLGQLRDQERKV